jgi:MFS family permease
MDDRSPFRALGFAPLWWARVLSTLAVHGEGAALGWQVYLLGRHTRSVEESAFLVGLLGLAQFAPLFLLALVAGATADRYDRRMILLACTGAEATCALALALVARHTGASPVPVFAVAVLLGTSRAFFSPASEATTPMLVSSQALPAAISWIALGDQGASVIGPWVGGALCGLSPAVAYLGAAVLHAASGAALLLVRVDTRPAPTSGSYLRQVGEGLTYVFRRKVVLGATSLDLFAVLLGSATALLPVYARDILSVGPGGFGVLRSGPAIGAVTTAFVLGRWPLRRRAGRWMFGGVAVFGAATLVFALSRSIAVSVVALVILGAADMVSVYVRQTLVQIATPDSIRGRVSAVAGLFVGASAELGEFETGLVARLLGPVGAAIFGGVGSLVVTGAWSWMFPSLLTADRMDGDDEGDFAGADALSCGRPCPTAEG